MKRAGRAKRNIYRRGHRGDECGDGGATAEGGSGNDATTDENDRQTSQVQRRSFINARRIKDSTVVLDGRLPAGRARTPRFHARTGGRSPNFSVEVSTTQGGYMT